MDKKGDLSIGIIIAAAIGVLVLVVLGAIFINQMKSTTSDIDSCSSIGAVEIDGTDASACTDGSQFAKKLNTTHVCCIKI
ncbi:MAG: hypothetical protein PHT94_03115 [Candidatus Nanoarchaeia archaeon]|nr:hypothetical protein [Candidatus Nanoarchaeia archaeon]